MGKQYEIIEVIWFDAQTHSGYAEDIGKLENWNPCYTKSIGYNIYEDKEKIILGFMLFQDDVDVNSVKHCQMIPKGMIKTITYLEPKRNRNPQKMKKCKGCYHKINPDNKTGYCYRCRRGKYNKGTGKWEGGIKSNSPKE